MDTDTIGSRRPILEYESTTALMVQDTMNPISLEEFDRGSDRFDALAGSASGIDVFCSLSDWGVPAHRALTPERSPWIFHSSAGYVTMMKRRSRQVCYLEPLEALWGLGCPIVGLDPQRMSSVFGDLLRASTDWDVAIVTGVLLKSDLLRSLRDYVGRHFIVRAGPTLTRCVASLVGGVSGYLSRRSGNFRRNLRRATRRVEAAGFVFERCYGPSDSSPNDTFDRILAIERRSWKGRQHVGIEAGPMQDFYREMYCRLVRRGGNRVLFARHRGHDVAYVLGGVFQGGYRGLQFSFDADYRQYSLGNVCQYHQITDLCHEGAERYDLGTWMEYKCAWAENAVDSVTLVITRSRESR